MNGPEKDDALVSVLKDSYSELLEAAPPVGAVTESAARRRRTRITAGVGVAAVLTVASLVGGIYATESDDGDGSTVAAPGDGEVQVLEAPSPLETFASSTVRHWLAHADAVVVVRAGEESEGNTVDVADGSGSAITGRDVVMQVQKVVWLAGDNVTLPKDFVVATAGWIDDGTGRQPLAYGEMPRMEQGNTYLMAIYSERPCTQGSDWAPLGSEAVWAVSDGIVGFGESAGHEVSGDQGQAEPGSFEAEMLDHSVDEVAKTMSVEAARIQLTAPTC